MVVGALWQSWQVEPAVESQPVRPVPRLCSRGCVGVRLCERTAVAVRAEVSRWRRRDRCRVHARGGVSASLPASGVVGRPGVADAVALALSALQPCASAPVTAASPARDERPWQLVQAGWMFADVVRRSDLRHVVYRVAADAGGRAGLRCRRSRVVEGDGGDWMLDRRRCRLRGRRCTRRGQRGQANSSTTTLGESGRVVERWQFAQ